ncbi:MAG TPA: hypothetical protein VMW16_10875 [Sedimentisphaerales bacterium]|nr:hypothetical protein [Sedimentisphaerales bacterium]
MKINRPFGLRQNKPNLSRRSLLAAPKCSTKPRWRSRIKPNFKRKKILLLPPALAWGFGDGLIGGLIFAWLYNLLAGKFGGEQK